MRYRGVDYTDSAGKIHQSSPFILRLDLATSLSNRRRGSDSSFLRKNRNRLAPRQSRQTIGFIGFGGSISSTCTTASSYTLTSTQLTGLINSNTIGYFSVSLSTIASPGYAPFVPISPAGDISTGFSITNNGILLWSNANFFQGQARFCYDSSGNIYAVFLYAAQPAWCTLAEISVVALSGCVNPTSLVGPSG